MSLKGWKDTAEGIWRYEMVWANTKLSIPKKGICPLEIKNVNPLNIR